MENDYLLISQSISCFIAKTFRQNFGKGPEAISVSFGGNYLTIYLNNFISPIEQRLLLEDDEQTVEQMRKKMMEALIPEIKAYLEITTGRIFTTIYYDWGLNSKSLAIVGVSKDFFGPEDFDGNIYQGKEILEEQMHGMCRVQKKEQAELTSIELNSRKILIDATICLSLIERGLIERGHGDLVKAVAREIIKDYLKSISFEKMLKRRLVDVFIDWDFSLDKCLTLLVFNPNKT